MDRRKFFGALTGAVAAVAGGLTAIATGRPTRPELPHGWRNYTGTYSNVDKAALLAKMRQAKARMVFMPPLIIEDWPAKYSLAVKLPQPKNRPIQNIAGLSYWIERPTEVVECWHAGSGFYVGQHRGMRLRAVAERRDGKLICNNACWNGEWNA